MGNILKNIKRDIDSNKNTIDTYLNKKVINLDNYDVQKKIIKIPLLEQVIPNETITSYTFDLLNFPELFINMSHIQPKYEFTDGYKLDDITLETDFKYAWIQSSENNYILEIITYADVYLQSSFTIKPTINLKLELIILNERDYNL